MTMLFAEAARLPEGWATNVLVRINEDGRIRSVESNAAPAPDAERVPLLLAAPANLHSHAFQRAMAGLTERRGPTGRDSFWTWRELMYRFLDVLAPEDVEAIAQLVYMEMLEAGYASVAEFHYLHHRPGGEPYASLPEMAARIAAASSDTGIGLTLLPVHYARGGVDGSPLHGGQQRFGNDLDRFVRLYEASEDIIAAMGCDAGIGIAPHSLRAVSPEDLRRLAALRPGLPLHMHIAEQVKEVEDVAAAFGAPPVDWLFDHVSVDGRWCLIHATHMTARETARLAASGAVAGLCPFTEASLGDGIFNGADYAAAGGAFGVGSDSNILVTLSGELRQLEYAQRLRDRARVVLADQRSAGTFIFDNALSGGAQALGRASGAIAPGLWADLLALDMDHPSLTGLAGDTAVDAFVFATGEGAVRDVWSAGRHMVRQGRHVARGRIVSRYRECMASIRDRLDA
mgnify:CR=1 FL=1